jgi:hypothetical protein
MEAKSREMLSSGAETHFLLAPAWGLKSPPPNEFKSGKQARAEAPFGGTFFFASLKARSPGLKSGASTC